jgi:hypothetical protein
MSEIIECTNPACQRPFYVSELGGPMPGSKEVEEINCPHCRTQVDRRMTNGFFQTAALSQETEAEYNRNNPR